MVSQPSVVGSIVVHVLSKLLVVHMCVQIRIQTVARDRGAQSGGTSWHAVVLNNVLSRLTFSLWEFRVTDCGPRIVGVAQVLMDAVGNLIEPLPRWRPGRGTPHLLFAALTPACVRRHTKS